MGHRHAQAARIQGGRHDRSRDDAHRHGPDARERGGRALSPTARVDMDFSSTPEQDAIRDAVRELCARYPDEYWRDLDRRSAYPHEFVGALTEAGLLGALIPSQYGGAGLRVAEGSPLPQGDNSAGGKRGRAHPQEYTKGT